MSVSGFISSVLEKIRAHRHHFDEILYILNVIIKMQLRIFSILLKVSKYSFYIITNIFNITSCNK